MLKIRRIDAAHCQDIHLPNEPFAVWGRLIPSCIDAQWRYRIDRFPESETGEMCFPDEDYDDEAMQQSSVFLGAYDGEQCIGLAIMQDAMFKHMYLYDLKVCRAYRRAGVASALMREAKQLALEKGYRGVYTIAQDNNLSACLFYLHCGFCIGGFDSHVYHGSNQEGKADVIFYWDA